MTTLRKICTLFILIAYVMCMVSCSKKNEKDDRVINIYDNSDINLESGAINIVTNGGDLNTDFIKDFKSAVRLIPTKEGYVFAGWYSDEEFTSKINPASPSKAHISKGTAYAKWIVVETKTYNLRGDNDSIVTITDSGRENQTYDVVSFSSDYKINDLINSGYKKLKITVKLDVAEVDDGYQYIFLYSNTDCAGTNISSITDAFDKYVFGKDEADPSLIYMYKFAHGGDGAYTSWGIVSFTVTIDTDRLTDDLIVRYGASGKLGDDWRNNNLVVSITPIQ